MADKELVNFIIEARKRGYSDIQIKEALIKNNWQVNKIEEAFNSFNPKFKSKNQICIFLGNDILKSLEKRGKANMFTISEQIEDILRRSCVRGTQTKISKEKIDDLLVECFSRSRKGRKNKNLF
jgi:hypothetical protein